jgi:hypothetical protein
MSPQSTGSATVTAPALSWVERAILSILDGCPEDEVSGRDLRSVLRRHGFRRTAPAFYFTMMGLEDKGLVTCREEIRRVDGMAVKDRYYQRRPEFRVREDS